MKICDTAENYETTAELLKYVGINTWRILTDNWNSVNIISSYDREDIKNSPINFLLVKYRIFKIICKNKLQSTLGGAQLRKSADFRSSFRTMEN